MKRLFAAAAALLLALSASAQGFIVKGGVDFQKTPDRSHVTYNSWFAGIGVQSFSRSGFSVQPELLYRVNSGQFDGFMDYTMNSVELPVAIQWGIDLLVAKPFIFLAPTIGYDLSNTVGADKNMQIPVFRKIVDHLEYGAGAGFGVNIWKVQIVGKYNWVLGRAGESDISFSEPPVFDLSLGVKF